MSAGAGRTARLMVVCEGNVCRSPAAELLLRSALGGDSGIEVGSAGLRAPVGEPVAEPVRRMLAARGLRADGAARQLTSALVAGADLVLTMTAAQRAMVVSQVPAAVRRTFVLREFAGLARLGPAPEQRAPAGRLAALVAGAGAARALRGPTDDDDVPDPYGCPDAVYARVLGLVDRAVTDVVDVLRGGSADPSGAVPAGEGAMSPFGVVTRSRGVTVGSDLCCTRRARRLTCGHGGTKA